LLALQPIIDLRLSFFLSDATALLNPTGELLLIAFDPGEIVVGKVTPARAPC
jgi:hypothetical protein